MLDMSKINEALARINTKLENLEASAHDKLNATLETLDPREIVQYQEVKSIAQAEGRITVEVALWIYNTIGHWSKSPLADRVIITQLIALWTGVIHK